MNPDAVFRTVAELTAGHDETIVMLGSAPVKARVVIDDDYPTITAILIGETWIDPEFEIDHGRIECWRAEEWRQRTCGRGGRVAPFGWQADLGHDDPPARPDPGDYVGDQ